MATRIINDLIDLNQSGSTSGLKGCAGTTAQQPTESFDIEYLIVGGGGTASGSGSGGGGAGGLVTGTKSIITGVSQALQVGAGGIADTTLTNQQPNGDDSGFAGLRAIGGGSGQRRADGTSGGSGAGAGIDSNSTAYVGGSGTTGQGNDGGNTSTSYQFVGAGGGGSGNPLADTNGVGASSSANQGGNGGSGTNMTSFISVSNATDAGVGEIVGGTNVFFAGGGGGGGSQFNFGGITGGSGGSGGGGAGSQTDGTRGTNGTANTGGGGGAGVADNNDSAGGDGGSGVVILKYDNTVVNSFTVDGTLVAPTTTTTTSTCNYPTTASALYQLNGNANDTCGSYNGTVNGGVTFATGKYGQAALFSGSNSEWIETASPPLNFGTSNYTVSLWVNTTNIAANQAMINLYDGAGMMLNIVQPNGYVRLYHDGGTAVNILTSAITENEWYHVCVTMDHSAAAKIYINANLENTKTGSNLGTDPGGTFYIGNEPAHSSYYMQGMIDQVRIFPSALSASQVTDLYNEVAHQTKFTNGNTDTIVFKEGAGNITFTKSPDKDAEIGMLRCNTTLGQMEHYTATGYKDFTNL